MKVLLRICADIYMHIDRRITKANFVLCIPRWDKLFTLTVFPFSVFVIVFCLCAPEPVSIRCCDAGWVPDAFIEEQKHAASIFSCFTLLWNTMIMADFCCMEWELIIIRSRAGCRATSRLFDYSMQMLRVETANRFTCRRWVYRKRL